MRSSRSSAISPSEEIASRTDSARLSPIQSRLGFFETLKKGKTRYVAACAGASKKQRPARAHRKRSTNLFYRARYSRRAIRVKEWRQSMDHRLNKARGEASKHE